MSEPLLFEGGSPGRCGASLPDGALTDRQLRELLPDVGLRDELPLPELSELEVARHYTHLSQKNYSIDSGFYPLGSCTMKYNPKLNEEIARLPGMARLHPLQPESSTQGALQIVYEMQQIMAQIAGMDAATLQPAAGAHGELLGLMLIRAYHEDHGQSQRDLIFVADSAHGTNPASAARCGYRIASVRTNARGRVDLAHLKEQIAQQADSVAGLMLTNPNTLGLFETEAAEICAAIHSVGGLTYCDGANMNALVGRARPGDMGFDVMHFNLHKTFSTPHGGGGPGSGPVAVKNILEPYLPIPLAVRKDDGFAWDRDRPKTIGRIHGWNGSFLCVLRAYAYIMIYGRERLGEIADHALLNANYLRVQLGAKYESAYDELCMHECVFSAKKIARATGVRALDIAKRLMDYGFHPPTIYFPLIVPEALMIEPTETESRETLDSFIEAMLAIAEEIERDPELVKSAPLTTPVRKIDEATAARRPCVCWTADDPST